MSQEAISAPRPFISSWRTLTQKVIDEIVIFYYIFVGKFFSEFLNVQINVIGENSNKLLVFGIW